MAVMENECQVDESKTFTPSFKSSTTCGCGRVVMLDSTHSLPPHAGYSRSKETCTTKDGLPLGESLLTREPGGPGIIMDLPGISSLLDMVNRSGTPVIFCGGDVDSLEKILVLLGEGDGNAFVIYPTSSGTPDWIFVPPFKSTKVK